ncbi:glucans biosynthesis glucosyltransferase MdoH [Xanthobacter sp. KR7-65]|uniref:glucans biosynthesis glucosyltransferase MdoH n=1 Tax=Xanthobacter sp. KR7-65 TaxID=3156612 RepID=UPI0032B4337B
MDVLNDAAPATTAPPRAALPPEAPLAMPVQHLGRRPERSFRQRLSPSLLARRAFVFGGAIALTVLAAFEMYEVLDVGGLTYLECAVLVLFVVLFAWIALAFTNAIGGAFSLRAGKAALDIEPGAPLPDLSIRVALLMPCYNEEPGRVFAGLEATWRSLQDTGRGGQFDVFILSDSTDPDIWVAEEAAFLALCRRTGGRFYYRHRAQNTDRKAGNIAEWVTRFGGAYEAMLILDADSVMTGDCMVRIAAALERNPSAALIQTLPVIVGGRTLFARLQQFAGRLYGPLIAQGLAWWHGPQSNYWGHNAIIRTRAFAGAAGLPHLSGRKPFGGHILSHDFVEAALLVRAGWGVYMVPGLAGSYEEGPPSLTDLAVRDRRWCQGNLQHAAVLPARGLSAPSRIHLLTGIGSYVSAPLWLMMLLAGLLTALQARFVPPDYFPSGFALFPVWPAQDPVRAAWVFGGTIAVLLLPKFIAFGLMLGDGGARRGFGGAGRTFLGMLSEIILSGLMAPVTMVSQSFAVVSILMGRDGGWHPQRRDDGSLGWRPALRHFLPHTLIGLGFAAATAAISLPLMAWMSPVILGLVAAVPLAVWTSRPRADGLLMTPEAQQPPDVLRAAMDLRAALAEASEPMEAVARLAADPGLLAFHRDALPAHGQRLAGDFRPERLVARAKIEDCEARDEALALLSAKEKAAALADDWSLPRLLALPAQAGPAQAR